jgi:hypothetical protein
MTRRLFLAALVAALAFPLGAEAYRRKNCEWCQRRPAVGTYVVTWRDGSQSTADLCGHCAHGE